MNPFLSSATRAAGCWLVLTTLLLGCSANLDDAAGAAPVNPELSTAKESATQHAAFGSVVADDLLDTLYEQIRDHTSIGYRAARRELLAGLDSHGGNVECVYTGALAAQSVVNIEHSWPQSLGASTEPARSDLHHLFVTTQTANSRRSNYRFGNTQCHAEGSSCRWSDGGSYLGTGSDTGNRVFEVRNARRGDIARAHFYFATRYRTHIEEPEESTLRNWHEQDPVDTDERSRNDAIEAIQHNRNPYIDAPELVSQINDF
jgi:deoxyribonuclease I